MNSLKGYNCSDLPAHQPVSKAAMETLQQRALEGDSEGKAYFRKYIIGLGMHIAQEEAREKGLDLDYLLEHIDVNQLEKVGYQKSFSVFQNETIHIDTIRLFINKVINKIYTKTLNEKYIQTELYKKAVVALEQNPELYSLPEPVVDGIPTALFKMIRDNEQQLIVRRMMIEADKIAAETKFRKLKEFIRDCNLLSYGKKLNLLINLTQAGEKRRDFFYYRCGISDGAMKTIEETANHFGIDVNKAKKIWSSTIYDKSTRFMCSCRQDDPFVIDDLIDFLCENEQNKKERERFEQKVKECRKYWSKDYMK